MLGRAQANHLNVAQPAIEGHQLGALFKQLASLISEQFVEHFAALFAIWEQKQPEEKVAQVEDKDHERVTVRRALQQLLQQAERALVIQLLQELVVVFARADNPHGLLDLFNKE